MLAHCQAKMSYIIEHKKQPRRLWTDILADIGIPLVEFDGQPPQEDKELLSKCGWMSDEEGEVTYGYTYKDKGKYTIYINSCIPNDLKRMTIAHEVAHLLLGHLTEGNGNELSQEQKEFEAESLGYIIYSYIDNPFYRK